MKNYIQDGDTITVAAPAAVASGDFVQVGRVRGIAVGYMNFLQKDGSSIPTYRADADVYRSRGVMPPPDAD